MILAVAISPIAYVGNTSQAETAIFQERISDANGPNASYNMDVAPITSGFNGTLVPDLTQSHLDDFHPGAVVQVPGQPFPSTVISFADVGGGGSSVEAWYRTLFRWDLSSLQGKGTVDAARMTLTMQPVADSQNFPAEGVTFSLFPIVGTENKTWVRSQVGAGRLQLDENLEVVPWESGCGQFGCAPGVDYDPNTPLAEITIPELSRGRDTITIEFNSDGLDHITSWINNPNENGGFVMMSEDLEALNDPNIGGDTHWGRLIPDDVPTTLDGRYPRFQLVGTIKAAEEDRPILEVDYTPIAPIDGDYNGNGILDAADYSAWLAALGGTDLLNDPTPGTVDLSDYQYWKANLGATGGNGSGLSDDTQVPEPGSLLIVSIALGFFHFPWRSWHTR